MLILGVLRSAGDFHENGQPLLVEAVHMVTGIDRIPPSQLRLLRNGTELELSGGFSFGTAAAVSKQIETTPTIKVIHLNSIGGRLTEADRVAEIVRDKKLITYVATECDSACTIPFMSGQKRYLGDGAKLGFHSSSILGSDQPSDELNRSMLAAYRARGVAPAFIKRALSTPPTSIWYPTKAELLAAKAIDGVVDSRTYGLSGVVGWQNVADIEMDLAQVAPFAMLKKYDPAHYRQLQDRIVTGVQEGWSVLEIQGELHAYLVKYLIPTYLKHGPDGPLVRYWKVQIAEVRELATADVRYCNQFFYPNLAGPALDFEKNVSADVRQKDLDALAALIEGTALDSRTTVETPLIKADILAIVQHMSRKDPRLLDAMVHPAAHKDDPKLTCEAIVTFYDRVIALPEDRAGNVLRFVVAKL